MDKLQHIDNLLKQATAQVPANALVTDADWDAIEKKLRHRKNHRYAMWFFLALIVSTSSLALLWSNITQNTQTPAHTQEVKKLPTQENNSTKTVVTKNKQITPQNRTYQNTTKSNTNTAKNASSIAKPLLQNTPQTIVENTIAPTTAKTLDHISIANNTAIKFEYNRTLDFTLLTPKISIEQKTSNTSTHKVIKNPTNLARWEVGVSFTPSVSSKIVSENNELAGFIHKNYNSFVAAQEGSSFASSLGFNLQYHPRSRIYVSSGLFLTQRNESVDYNYTITDFPVNGENGINSYTPLNPLALVKIDYSGSNSYHFVEIPLNIGYKQPLSRNFEIRTQMGLSYLSLINREGMKGNYNDLNLDNLKELSLNTSHIATNIKTGVYYNTRRLAIGLEPTFGVNLNNLESKNTSALQTKPYSYGLNISTNLKLYKE